MTLLQERVASCIQTLLDIRPGMPVSRRDSFSAEFSQLEDFLSRVSGMKLAEDEVRRLELLTQNFLSESGCVSRGRQ